MPPPNKDANESRQWPSDVTMQSATSEVEYGARCRHRKWCRLRTSPGSGRRRQGRATSLQAKHCLEPVVAGGEKRYAEVMTKDDELDETMRKVMQHLPPKKLNPSAKDRRVSQHCS
ncbi:hypothetical protein PR003_g23283 [Phytophthora rubi]|uniref:Uncharacterized protein n=1 Tax=Phytophthora rubi TaxID=129364 RepID=A0A6A3J1S7_9STRA|nr:hypothetical protein PR001_g22110 [Phytophthora rubi]KAE9298281.1 hypothetical protein PR003_g23283 [Phytophthora rubi]